MAKLQNHISEILKAAGRPSDYTNRSFYTKGLNAAIDTGLVKVEVCEPGKIWKMNNGGKANIKVSAAGRFIYNYVTTITPGDILPLVGRLLLDPIVKEKISADVHLRADHCRKCNGQGIIPQFYYYCSGICFDCGGTGANFSKEKTTVKINDGNAPEIAPASKPKDTKPQTKVGPCEDFPH